MSGDANGLYAHLSSGVTTVCYLWRVERIDGQVYGFTDHDVDLDVDGVVFRADTGLTAQALQQTTGMSVDNTEAIGALSSLSISEEDLGAGRFDRATVTAWMVNWADPQQKVCLFQGTFGEVTRGNGMFRAELRGLTEALSQPQGRTFQRACSAILGDSRCGFDLAQPGYVAEGPITASTTKAFQLEGIEGFAENWFAHGRLTVVTGAAAGLFGVIRTDILSAATRRLELWQSLPITVAAGDIVRLEAGCDRSVETCRAKFDNLLNFRGFPHIPGEDWVTSYPVSSNENSGGSRTRGQTFT
jgi:uncharacterized phage protein (TIGR02218 family)